MVCATALSARFFTVNGLTGCYRDKSLWVTRLSISPLLLPLLARMLLPLLTSQQGGATYPRGA